jgi:hypothetical protein
LEIVKQGRPWRIWGCLSRDQNVVHASQAVLRQKLARGFAKPAAGAVAENGVSDLAAGGQPEANRTGLGAPAGLDQKRRSGGASPGAHEQELGARAEPFDDGRCHGV